MKLTKYILALAALSIACTTQAKPKIQPEADFHKIVREYTMAPDGSVTERYYKELTINTYNAMNSLYGETFIVYNPEYQKITFNTVRTRQADGTIVEAPANAFNEVLPAAAANAPDYNHLKEMVVTHTGLELGATIYLDYTVTSKPGYIKELDIALPLQELSPIREYTISVSVPENKTVTPQVFGIKGSVKQETGERNGYTWMFKNIPAATREAMQPTAAGYAPYFTATTYPTQEAAFAWLDRNTDIPASWNSLIDKITANKNAENDKIDAIAAFVAQSIDGNRLSLIETGGAIRTPDQTLGTSYGTTAEKALLLTGMLRHAGIEAYIAVGYPKNMTEKVTGLAPATLIGVMAKQDGKEVLLQVNGTRSAPEEFLHNYDLYVTGSGTEYKGPGETLYVQYKENTTIGTEKMHVTSTRSAGWTTGGNSNTPAPPVIETPVEWDSNGYLTYVLSQKTFGDPYVRIPAQLPSVRKSSLQIGAPVKEVQTYTIELGEGVELKSLPRNVNISNKAGQLTISISQEGSTVKVAKAISLPEAVISAANYADFRKIVMEWNNPNNSSLIFKKK